uniref:Uncharacterized protein n=1 Tax=Anguilla anguilla TaxID=7936 RepID=A0A0E9SBJ8_ANGAN
MLDCASAVPVTLEGTACCILTSAESMTSPACLEDCIQLLTGPLSQFAWQFVIWKVKCIY